MKLKPHLSISLSDDDLRTIVIIFRCYSRLRLWTLDSTNSSFASAPKLQCRPCMKMKLPQNAGHGHILGPSRPHPTPTRSWTQKKEKKRSERHEGFAGTKILKPNDAKESNVKDACGPFKLPSINPSRPQLIYIYTKLHAQTKQDPSASRVLKLLWI